MGNKPRDSNSGQYTPEVTADEIVELLERNGRMRTTELANEVELTHDGMYKRLVALEEQGKVDCEDWGNLILWKPV